MDLKYVRSELQKLSEIIDSWNTRQETAALERDLVLEKLRKLYDAVRFGADADFVAAVREDAAEEAAAEPAPTEIPVSIDLGEILPLDPFAVEAQAEPASAFEPDAAAKRDVVGEAGADFESESFAEVGTAFESESVAEAGAVSESESVSEENIRREGELKLASDKLSSVSSGVKELLEEKETLEKRIESVSSGAEAARSQIDELKETLENKEKELESITGDSKTLQKNREEVASKAAEIRLRIVSLQKDVEANTDEITRLKNRKTGHLDRLSELDGEIREIEEKNDELRALTERLSADEKALKANHGDAQNQINELISQRDELEKQANDLRLHERAKSEERERLSGDIARLEERKIAMRNEYDNLTSKLYDEYQLTRREAAALEIEIDDYSLAAKRLAELKSQIRALGSVNVSAIEEYKEVSERYEFLSGQINDVETSRAELNKMIDDLTGKMAEQFREQFNRINSCFGQTFIELFGGGKAELRLEDERDVLGSS